MQSTVGPVKSVQMVYTATGKSTGQATVLFKNKGDGNKAHAACEFIYSFLMNIG
jgi:THO complex subunit 4